MQIRAIQITEREKKTKGPSPEPVISPASVFTLIVGELPNHAQGKISPGLYRVGINLAKCRRALTLLPQTDFFWREGL